MLVVAVDAFHRQHLGFLVVVLLALAQAGEVVQVGVAAEHFPARAIPRPPGEAGVAFDEARVRQAVAMVVGVGVVQPAGDAEAFVELVHEPVGGDPTNGPPTRCAMVLCSW